MEIFFEKLLNKPMQRESDFGGRENFFLENSIAPPESQLVCPFAKTIDPLNKNDLCHKA